MKIAVCAFAMLAFGGVAFNQLESGVRKMRQLEYLDKYAKTGDNFWGYLAEQTR